jgi:hypothetical protein
MARVPVIYVAGENENAIVTNSRAIESGDLATDLPLACWCINGAFPF